MACSEEKQKTKDVRWLLPFKLPLSPRDGKTSQKTYLACVFISALDDVFPSDRNQLFVESFQKVTVRSLDHVYVQVQIIFDSFRTTVVDLG